MSKPLVNNCISLEQLFDELHTNLCNYISNSTCHRPFMYLDRFFLSNSPVAYRYKSLSASYQELRTYRIRALRVEDCTLYMYLSNKCTLTAEDIKLTSSNWVSIFEPSVLYEQTLLSLSNDLK